MFAPGTRKIRLFISEINFVYTARGRGVWRREFPLHFFSCTIPLAAYLENES